MRHEPIRTFIGFLFVWAILDRSAAGLGSLRGEAGVLVCMATLCAAVFVEVTLSRQSPVRALQALGLRVPGRHALGWSLVLSGLLLLYFPVFAAAKNAHLEIREGSLILAAGMFVQAGIAEEILFRGFLFRRLREGRSFWHAAWLAAVPFTAVHALLFLSLDFPIAMASFLLAFSLSFPLAWLFERSQGSIWPPAILHAVLQGAVKLVEVEQQLVQLAIGWMILGGSAPWMLFLLRPHPARIERRTA